MANFEALARAYGTLGFDVVINQLYRAISNGDKEQAHKLLDGIIEHGEIECIEEM